VLEGEAKVEGGDDAPYYLHLVRHGCCPPSQTPRPLPERSVSLERLLSPLLALLLLLLHLLLLLLLLLVLRAPPQKQNFSKVSVQCTSSFSSSFCAIGSIEGTFENDHLRRLLQKKKVKRKTKMITSAACSKLLQRTDLDRGHTQKNIKNKLTKKTSKEASTTKRGNKFQQHGTYPPLFSSPHAHSFVLGTAGINIINSNGSTLSEGLGFRV